MMAQALMIIGASIFGTLGLIHLLCTIFTNKFEAYDSSVTEAMKGSTPVLTKDTSVWNAWVGFNISHSLGAIIVAGIYIPLVVTYSELLQQSLWFSSMPVLIGLSYLCVAKLYWFKVPFWGIFISTVCFISAALLINL